MKRTTLIISVAAVVAILSGIAAVAYANGTPRTVARAPTVGCNNNGDIIFAHASKALSSQSVMENGERMIRPLCRWKRGLPLRWGPGRFLEVSQEFKDNVLSIMEADSDVKALLDDSYEVTQIRPIIKAVVEADGTVVVKATNATVTMQKDTTGRAIVWINVEESQVMRIEILTRTVIEKP